MRVLVAMSGGVDSSVVAGLLHAEGHEVIGVTLQLYDHGAATKKGACCAGQDIHDARRVADRLGIAHYVIDAEARFRQAVIGDFADSYAAGRTPVPCVRCNQSVKFTDLLGLAGDLGAEVMATGHYVRQVDGPDGPALHRAADLARDQSWFLFATTRAQLARSIFPLGDMPDKTAVRAQATAMGWRWRISQIARISASFLLGGMIPVVAALRPDAAEPGDIVTRDGAVLDRHAGVGSYTVGQARRLGAAATVGGQRQVVLALDAATRRVIVGPRSNGTHRVTLQEVNWLVDPVERRCTVKLRARDDQRPATIIPTDTGAEVLLDDLALPAPGQACVFYNGDRVLGGGFITAGTAVDLEGAVGVSARLRD